MVRFFYSTSYFVGEGNGNPLQCSYLENPRDGGAWWAAVSGVTQSRTRLKRLSSSSSYFVVISNLICQMSSSFLSVFYSFYNPMATNARTLLFDFE